MKMKMKRLLVFLSVSCLLYNSGCKSHKEQKDAKVKFLVTSPLLLDTTITKEYVCQIRSIQHIEIRALEKGYLEKIFVDEGKFVKKGQRLFQIMPLMYNAELEKSQAEANFT